MTTYVFIIVMHFYVYFLLNAMCLLIHLFIKYISIQMQKSPYKTNISVACQSIH